MSISRESIERRLAHFADACRRAGLKVTHQRLEIFREVAEAEDHPDAETVFERLRERLPAISLDTVYRTLWLLDRLGLVTTIEPPEKRARFDANLDRHHHFVCIRCGLTRDFYSDELDALHLPEAARIFGTIATTHVELRGVCIDCVRAERKGPDDPNDEEGS